MLGNFRVAGVLVRIHLSIKEDIYTFLENNLQNPLRIYQLEVRDKNKHFLVQLVLDNLENKYGSASVDQCVQVSRILKEYLEASDEGLNYTLEVSSAGAERELKLPEDLIRFQGLPVKLKIQTENLVKTGVYTVKGLDDSIVSAEVYGKKKSKKQELVEFSLADILRGNLYLDI